ncbi:ABC transporter ATP-binding protein [Roseitranquillus sediminis]|uniref:ABC transporter ATP-binding protein n=1 Tax=Roseitranquillus sediminis TaxID=2809051 RepID=UPI001D0C6923|nr:ABC transporter ATP-binding protein [Roseitranquillus sediminis]MBM9594771.1 ABC transporter ATP-binding protein [Roseitranquillus sediminis]
MTGAASEPLLQVRNLSKLFPVKGSPFSRTRETVKAVQDASLDVGRGEVVGLVGESGSGKTTLGRSILRLIEPTSGEVRFDGVSITALSARQLRPYRRRMQIVFQDPFGSLNPRFTAERIIGEALDTHRLARNRAERRDLIVDLLEKTGLGAAHLSRYPHEFSGGQRQRIGIARALAVGPDFVLADEPVSALDVSVQAQVLNLLRDLQRELDLAMLMVAHDLGVVEYIADRVIVMYLGRIMEVAPARALYSNPVHPYTQALLEAVPRPDPKARRSRTLLKGEIPSPIHPPSGCVFRTRCPIATTECAEVIPPLEETAPGHLKACIRR